MRRAHQQTNRCDQTQRQQHFVQSIMLVQKSKVWRAMMTVMIYCMLLRTHACEASSFFRRNPASIAESTDNNAGNKQEHVKRAKLSDAIPSLNIIVRPFRPVCIYTNNDVKTTPHVLNMLRLYAIPAPADMEATSEQVMNDFLRTTAVQATDASHPSSISGWQSSLQASLGNILLQLILLGKLGPSGKKDDPVYNPPNTQHFMFQDVTVRYEKDNDAFGKVYATTFKDTRSNNGNTGGQREAKKGWFGRTTSKSTLINSGKERDQKEQLFAALSQPIKAPTSNMTMPQTCVVITFQPTSTSISPSEVKNSVENLSDTVSFLIQYFHSRRSAENDKGAGRKNRHFEDDRLEILLILESPGGGVQDFGLAASQLKRLRDVAGMMLTICVDRVAVSGGYMMACQSSPGQLYAAPYALVGSIGIISSTINFRGLLESHGVDAIVLKGGKEKTPLGALEKITHEDKAIVQQDINTIHNAFKTLVAEARPNVENIEEVGSGATWIALEAMKRGLVDRIITSDEYLSERINEGTRVFKLSKYEKPLVGFQSPFGLFAQSMHRLCISNWRNIASGLHFVGIMVHYSMRYLMDGGYFGSSI